MSPNSNSVGDIVLVPFPFTDLSASKPRPALILANGPFGDVIVAFITSQPQSDSADSVPLSRVNAEFGASGLRIDSTIRLSRLATVQSAFIERRLGAAGPKTMESVRDALRFVFGLS